MEGTRICSLTSSRTSPNAPRTKDLECADLPLASPQVGASAVSTSAQTYVVDVEKLALEIPREPTLKEVRQSLIGEWVDDSCTGFVVRPGSTIGKCDVVCQALRRRN